MKVVRWANVISALLCLFIAGYVAACTPSEPGPSEPGPNESMESRENVGEAQQAVGGVGEGCVSNLGGWTCNSGLTCCTTQGPLFTARTCRNLSNDEQNCGSCGTQCGAGLVCKAGACWSGCDIGGTYYASGAANPSNACQVCTPSTSTTAWSNKADGLLCATGQVCSGGTCSSGCYIGGTFYAPAAVSPSNACQVCTPATSTIGWSNQTNGTGCNDGSACTTGDVCTNGSCGGTPHPCLPTACQATSTCDGNGGCTVTNKTSGTACPDDGNPCTSDTCDGAGTCAHTTVATGTNCGWGMVCNGSTCSSGCFIGGTLYASGAVNPSNACQICTPQISTVNWSNQANDTGCSDGNACTKNDVCTYGVCVGTSYTCTPTSCQASSTCDGNGGCTVTNETSGARCPDDGNPCTTDACDGAGTCAHAAVATGTSCGTGSVCNGATCSSGCFIGGTFYAATTVDPTNACQVCTPERSTTAWSHQTSGTACPSDGDPCTTDACDGAGTCTHATAPVGTSCATSSVCDGAGTCSSACFIGGTLYASGTVNPANTCQVCKPGSSTTEWDTKLDYMACDDGDACTMNEVCTGGVCGGGTPYTCTPTSCQVSATCGGNDGCTAVNKTSGTACPDDGNPCTTDACDGAGTCAHAAVAAGTSCGTGLVCNGATCSSGCVIGGTFYASGAVNPSNACQVCAPGTSTTAWLDQTNGTTCNDGNACTQTDTCQSGVCVGSNPVVCGASDQCHDVGACDPATGLCSNQAKGSGTACDDGDACTQADTCQGGVCVGTPKLVDDGDANTIDACNPDTGVVTHTSCPPLDQTVATRLAEAAKCYYTGSNALQTGVGTGVIDVTRVAVLQGKVEDRNENPLSGVKVFVVGHTDTDGVSYGHVYSRADGTFQLVVNGGGPLTLRYQKQGFLTVDRQVRADWQHYTQAPNIVMIPLDPQVTSISQGDGVYQVARGSVQQDADGTRQAVLLFPGDTTVWKTIPAPGGGTTTVQFDGDVHVRATEYTVGPTGRKAMPAALPATTAYTYAVELSLDETPADALKVTFSNSIPFYVDNFLGFPVGTPVPIGYYDSQKQAWVASANGRVIEILAGEQINITGDGDGPTSPAAGTPAGGDRGGLRLRSRVHGGGTTGQCVQPVLLHPDLRGWKSSPERVDLFTSLATQHRQLG